jgi:hypothetical protein
VVNDKALLEKYPQLDPEKNGYQAYTTVVSVTAEELFEGVTPAPRVEREVLAAEARRALAWLRVNSDFYFDMSNWCHCLCAVMRREQVGIDWATREEQKLFFVQSHYLACWPAEFQHLYAVARTRAERLDALEARLDYYDVTGD